jgi:hypothetical protein
VRIAQKGISEVTEGAPAAATIRTCRRASLTSESLPMTVPMRIAQSEVQVMKTLNALGDIPTSSVPQVEMKGAKKENASPSEAVAARRPAKFGWRYIEREMLKNRDNMDGLRLPGNAGPVDRMQSSPRRTRQSSSITVPKPRSARAHEGSELRAGEIFRRDHETLFVAALHRLGLGVHGLLGSVGEGAQVELARC